MMRSYSWALLVSAVLSVGCGGVMAEPVDLGEGGGGSGGGFSCACDEGFVVAAACESESEACQSKTCGTETIGCVPIKACETNACVSSNLPGYGCATLGEECQTFGCHGDPAQNFICGDDQMWTDWGSLYFPCGDETCDQGSEYCENVSEAGVNQVFRCLPIPEGCSNETFCACEAALAVCPDASCGTTTHDGWMVSCW